MGSVSTATFSKLKTCPAAETLLLYGDSALAREARSEVAAHLSNCDFCDAELQLLAKFPPRGRARFRPVKMPLNLYRLAKDLLRLTANDADHIVETLYERGSLTLTDA